MEMGMSCTPPEVRKLANKASDNLMPEKSAEKYEKEFVKFNAWCQQQNVINITENVILAYFENMSYTKKSSTMWSNYSMIKTCLNIKKNIDISKFAKVLVFLKRKSVNYAPKKSKILDDEHVNKFIVEANDDVYLAMKKMMWIEDSKRTNLNDSDDESESSGEEIPIWVRGEQRWVSGVVEETSCLDIIEILLQDEKGRGRHVGVPDEYHITERWRGVEQPLEKESNILDIWCAWGTAQPEVKISLRRIKNDRALTRRSRYKSDTSLRSDKSAFKTIHPKRLNALQNEKQPSSTEELLKLVLAQGEVIRKQLKKLRHSEHQIGCIEDKTHKARVRKHGSNYLLETYLKGLPEAADPENDGTPLGDKNSDSGVVTEGDSEQSNHNKASGSAESSFERFSSPSSQEFSKDIKDDDTSSTISETTVRDQLDLFEKLSKLNKKILREEETLVKLQANFKKHNKTKNVTDELTKSLSCVRTELAKSSCEMQHNEVVLEESKESVENRRSCLENLHKDLLNEDQEFEMLQTLLYTQSLKTRVENDKYKPYKTHYTKELLDTLV